MMEQNEFLKLLTNPNYDIPGINSLHLFRVDPDFFELVRTESLDLIKNHQPSPTGNKASIKPWGVVDMYSLFNESGRIDDNSRDNNLSFRDKKFHYRDHYPNLYRFIEALPYLTNFRLNFMGRESGFTPHQVPTVFCNSESRAPFIVCRFHLPLATNPRAEMIFEREVVHFGEGNIYFFNNSSVHTAVNEADQVRIHAVWDMVLTKDTYDLMFSDAGSVPSFLERIPPENRRLTPLRTAAAGESYIKEYLPFLHSSYCAKYFSIRLYRLLMLEKLGLKLYQYQRILNRFRRLARTSNYFLAEFTN